MRLRSAWQLASNNWFLVSLPFIHESYECETFLFLSVVANWYMKHMLRSDKTHCPRMMCIKWCRTWIFSRKIVTSLNTGMTPASAAEVELNGKISCLQRSADWPFQIPAFKRDRSWSQVCHVHSVWINNCEISLQQTKVTGLYQILVGLYSLCGRLLPGRMCSALRWACWFSTFSSLLFLLKTQLHSAFQVVSSTLRWYLVQSERGKSESAAAVTVIFPFCYYKYFCQAIASRTEHTHSRFYKTSALVWLEKACAQIPSWKFTLSSPGLTKMNTRAHSRKISNCGGKRCHDINLCVYFDLLGPKWIVTVAIDKLSQLTNYSHLHSPNIIFFFWGVCYKIF